MSYHVLHLLEHGSYLYKRRGRLFCQTPSGGERSLPIENIKAVILAAKGLNLSAALISSLASCDAIILHCDDSYKPVAVTGPLSRIINQRILATQCAGSSGFHQRCWAMVKEHKIRNQALVIDLISLEQNPLERLIVMGDFDEARAARFYFERYFKILRAIGQNRTKRDAGWLNPLLNYGYAVLSALVHRAIVIHGLLPQLGIHHKPRYGTWPLVYDIMEPLRPVVDAHVWAYCQQFPPSATEHLLPAFARFIGSSLSQFRLPHKRYRIKLLDAVDFMVRSFATACEARNHEALWVPKLTPTCLGTLTRDIIKA